MYRVQAWNALGREVDAATAPMELKDALKVAVNYRDRGLRRITLINTETGEQFTDLEHFMRTNREA